MKKNWRYFDYCHKPYLPIATSRGKYLPDNLLDNSIQETHYAKAFLRLKKKIVAAIGPWNTVWGVKWDGGALSWEFYFYNHKIKTDSIRTTNLLKVLSSQFIIPDLSKINFERFPYFMWSLDINKDVLGSRKIQGVHAYVSGRADVLQGSSYYCRNTGYEFENHYDFFRIPQDMDQMMDKIQNSVVFSLEGASFIKRDLVKRLLPCSTVCLAIKKNQEGVYFSRVNVDQLIYFLEYFSYPDLIVDHVKRERKKLDHLLFDVAFDCALNKGKIVLGKSSYYGVF